MTHLVLCLGIDRIRNKLKWAPTPYKYTVKSGSAKRLKVIATEGFILFEMVSSRQDGLLQDKVTFLPDKLELTGLQFPLTTNSSPITRSVFPFPWLYSILPAYQFTWTRRAVSCALPFLFEITFITTNNPSAIKETLFAFLVPGNPYCVHKPWQWRGSYIKLSRLTSVNRSFSSLQWSNTCCLWPAPGRKDETRADCCVMTCFFSTLPRFSCSRPKNVGKWSWEFHIG